MNFLRHILRLFVAMLFSALGASIAFAAPINTSEFSFYQAENSLLNQTDDVGFAARAPPLAVPNVAITGGVTSMQGSAFALHGQETVAALFGFGVDLDAPNRGVEIPATTAQTQNLRTNLQRDGFRFDPGEEAHHIVAKNDTRAARSRELLAEAGVDVNSPANGVPLPGTRTTANQNNKAVHRGDVIHSDGYCRYVERELLDAPVNQRPTVIRRIADELERGEINWTD